MSVPFRRWVCGFFFRIALVVGLLEWSGAAAWAQGGGQEEAGRLSQEVKRLYEARKYEEAIPVAQRVVQLRKQQLGEQHPDYAVAISWLAGLYQSMGRYAEAEPLFRQALTVRKQHPDYATSLNNLAGLYKSMGRYAEAELLFRQALTICKQQLGEQHPDYAIALSWLATLYELMGRYAEAEPFFRQALTISRQQLGEQHPYYATALNNLAFLYNEMGRYAEAEPLFQQALIISKQQLGEQHPDYVISLHNLAQLYKLMGRYAEAEPLSRQALFILKQQLGEQHPDYANVLHNLAVICELLGRYTEAEATSNQAVSIKLQYLRRSFTTLSEREKQQFAATISGNTEARHSLLARQLTPAGPPPPGTARTFDHLLFTKGLLLAATAASERRLRASADTALLRRYTHWQTTRRQLLAAQNLPPAQQQQRGLDPARLAQQANEQERELAASSAAFAQGDGLPTTTWQQVQRALRPGQVAIELVRYRWRGRKWTDSICYSAYLLTPTCPAPLLVVLRNGNELENRYLPAYRSLTQSPGPARGGHDANAHVDAALADARVLYRAFWQPIARALPPGTTTVFLSADGVYAQLNLATLQNPATGRYLLDETDVRLLGSTRELLPEPGPPSAAPGPSVLVGAPAYRLRAGSAAGEALALNTASRSAYARSESMLPAGEVPPLPGTARELAALQTQLTAARWPHRAFVGEQATEEAVRDVRRPRVLHIATHGFFVPAAARPAATHSADRELSPAELAAATDPMLRSGLLLAGVSNFREAQPKPATEDGILTAYEASLLDLQGTELVVLSACETGLGQAQAGEGVYGLQRGLRVAGARAVLMSLWKVDDAATQELMGAFYQSWLAGKSKRAALLAAQQQIRQRHPEPYYWGAFVLVGE